MFFRRRRGTIRRAAVLTSAPMQYFSVNELCASATARRLKIDNTPDATIIANITYLVNATLDPLRRAWGKPLIVTSGYRCIRLNTVVGGAYNSQHTRGLAADLTAGDAQRNKALYALCRRLHANGKITVDQCIDEYGCQWVHISAVPEGETNRGQFFAVGV